MEDVETKHLENGITVRVCYDGEGGDSDNCPFREDDESVKLVTFERNSRHSKWHQFDSPSEVLPWAKKNKFWAFPLFKYEHGGVAYSLGAFSCPWDSGQCGYVLMSKAEWPRQAKAVLSAKSHVESYSSWCNGEIYGYIIEDSDGEHLDSCWGYVGDSKYCLDEAMSNAEYHVKEAGETKAKAFAESCYEARPDLAPQYEATGV